MNVVRRDQKKEKRRKKAVRRGSFVAKLQMVWSAGMCLASESSESSKFSSSPLTSERGLAAFKPKRRTPRSWS